MGMLLGKLTGKNTPNEFTFNVEGNPRKFDFIEVFHRDHDKVLAVITNLTRDEEKTIAKCSVMGYLDDTGNIKPVRTPFEPNTAVYLATDDFIKEMIKLETTDGAFLGKLDGKEIPINIDLRKLLTKHIAILAKSGAGKSYTVGVLLEEIMERRVPLLIIDPHGEYSHLKYPNEGDHDRMEQFGVTAKGYVKHIREYTVGGDGRQIKLNNALSGPELIHMLPAKLSNAQMTLLYTALKDIDHVDFDSLLMALEAQDSSSKWNVMSIIDHLQKLDLFATGGTPFNELIQPGRCSIINLRGVSPDVQEIVVYKLMHDLFEARKKEKIPPFFAVVEEAHNFCPERGFGEAKPSKILRTIASEGRKFGLGLCVISQRPARVDKSVLSQITTQVVLKVTNPNDLKALSNSIEGLTSESEEEIRNLPIGTAIVTGVVDMPLFVNVRPRRSKHGGEAVDILEEIDKDKFLNDIHDFEAKDLVAVIRSKISKKEIEIIAEDPVKEIKTHLIPAIKVLCEWRGHEFSLLIELENGTLVRAIDEKEPVSVPNLNTLTKEELQVLEPALHLKEFSLSALQKKVPQIKAFKTSATALKKKGFLQQDGPTMRTTKSCSVITNPKKFATYQKVEYASIAYDSKKEPKLLLEEIKNRLNRFVNVKDHQDCFLEHFEPKFQPRTHQNHKAEGHHQITPQ